MSKLDEFFANVFKPGTPQCMLFCVVLALIAGLLLVFVGFWNTLLVAIVVAIGLFIGAVKDKKNAIRSFINRIFPPKDGNIPSKD